MAVYISPIASITPQICSEQATRQSTTTTISERPKMRTDKKNNPELDDHGHQREAHPAQSEHWLPGRTPNHRPANKQRKNGDETRQRPDNNLRRSKSSPSETIRGEQQ